MGPRGPPGAPGASVSTPLLPSSTQNEEERAVTVYVPDTTSSP